MLSPHLASASLTRSSSDASGNRGRSHTRHALYFREAIILARGRYSEKLLLLIATFPYTVCAVRAKLGRATSVQLRHVEEIDEFASSYFRLRSCISHRSRELEVLHTSSTSEVACTWRTRTTRYFVPISQDSAEEVE